MDGASLAGGSGSVREPASVVNAHVEALRQHLAEAVAAEQLSRRRSDAPAASVAIDLTSDNEAETDGPPPPGEARAEASSCTEVHSASVASRN